MSGTKEQTLIATLASNFLFKTLAPAELARLAQDVWFEHVAAHSIVVREGDFADALYLVAEGGVNVTKIDGLFLAYLGKGGFFGEMALFIDGSQRTASCETAIDTTFVVVRKEVFESFCEDHPSAALKIYKLIIKTMAERLQATSADLAMLMSSTQVRKQDDVSVMVERAKRARDARKAKEQQNVAKIK
jgi:CRP-like cAMP-binding protein